MANLSRFGGVPRSSIFLSEQAADQADVAAYGQFWVKNDTPNTPHFTDDAGNDRALVWVESGTFTPVIWDDTFSDAEGQTYTIQLGYYRKVGSLVTIFIDVAVNSLGTLTTTQNTRIGALPFAANSSIHSPLSVAFGDSLAITASQAVSAYVASGTNRIGLTKWSATTGTTDVTLAQFSAGGRVIVAGSYFTA